MINPFQDVPMTSGFNKLAECRHGRMLFNGNDMFVGRSLDLYGEFSETEARLFGQMVRPGDVVVEVGANLGALTLPIARLVGPQGMVVAYEPQRLVFQTLCANMALNSVTQAVCRQEAVGDAPGTLMVPQLNPSVVQNFGGLELGQAQQGESVPIVRLDDRPLPRCRLRKVDVEGMERAVLLGATETIRTHRPFLYVENDRQEKSADLLRTIAEFGYTIYPDTPPLYNPDNFRKNPENVFGNIASFNLLGVPPGNPIAIQGSEPIVVPDA